MDMRTRSSLVVAVIVAFLAAPAVAEEMKFTCSRDVWVSAVGEERDHSMGRTPTMKLKTIQEMCIMDFDLSKLKGRTVGGGWLCFHIVHDPEEVKRINIPLDRKHFLKGIGVSTVSADWVEGQAKVNYTVDKVGFGATFKEASYSRRPWAWAGGDLTDVTFSNGNTLQSHADLEETGNLWARVKIPDYLIQSLIVRDGFGLCLMDEIGYALANNFIHSREQTAFAPYLLVDVVGADKAPPPAPKVAVRPAAKEAHMTTGAVAIDLAGSADTFCYFVKVNGKDLARWRIPHPKKGKSTIVLDDVKGGEAISVEAVACDASGNRSPSAKAAGEASPALAAVPKLPASGWRPAPGDPPLRGGKLRVWALPEICKVKYHNGQLFEAAELGADPLAYQKANSVWEGSSGTIRTFGARGEIVAFQLCIERADRNTPLTGISIALDGLTGPGKIDADRIKLFRIWYVGLAEYAVPLPAGEKIEIPYKENKLGNRQRNQQVYVDIAIPQTAKAGDYTGKIRIAADGVDPFDLPVKLKVYDYAIPDKMRFNPELNIYAAPGGRPGNKVWFESFRVAHYNRCTLSITQAGHSDGIKVPVPLAGSGANVRVRDWSGFDKAYGPLLDGSAFKDLPRASQPLPTCQVPMSHGFPLGLDRYHIYSGPKRVKNVDLIHALMTPGDISKTFREEYKQGFRSFAAEIVRHVESKGWTDTFYQFYLDAKVHWRIVGRGSSYWILDEPYNYPDWQALRFWGKLFHEGVDPVPNKKAKWGYRCDISRPHWTRDWLNGVMDIMYAGGFGRRVRRCMIMAREGPFIVYSYGACNRPNVSHWNSAVWCLSTFVMGGDGVLPWQSLGGGPGSRSDSLSKPDPHGLIVPNVLGHGAIGSVRIMALRRGAQICESLLELGAKRGFNREQLRAIVASKVSPKGTLKQLNADDAAPVTFDKLDPARFEELREGIAKLIVGNE